MSNVRTILVTWLEENGYDGLVDADRECGCINKDIIPCDSCFDACQPAYRLPDTSGDYEYLMSVVKPEKVKG